MNNLSRVSRNSVLAMFLFCLAYIGFQLVYINHVAITVDEFWFAHRIYQFKSHLPYRDFSPYKTVLGYYLLLLPMLSGHGLMQPLLYMKNTLALLNGVLFFITSFWLTRFFSKSAVLTSLILIICSEFFLAYSADIRVDLLAYWFCLFSVLFLYENKYALAGMALGIGFLVSQKVLWYIFASDCVLLVSFMFFFHQLKHNHCLQFYINH